MLGIPDEAIDRIRHICDESLGGSVLIMTGELCQDSFLLEQFPVVPGGFRQSVRIQEDSGSLIHLNLILPVSRVFQAAQDKAAFVSDDLEISVAFSEDRILVTGVCRISWIS